MFHQLYPYFIRNKHLSLPGIGQFTIEVLPARTDIASKLIMPPVHAFRFTPNGDNSSKKFYAWLADRYQCSEWDAIRKLNDFVYEIKKVLQSGNRVKWNGVGFLQQTASGIEFETEEKHFIFEQQVVAEKVIRQNPEHSMLVGDRETTSIRMSEILAQPEPERSYSLLPKWWALAIVLSFLSIMLIGWHFSEHGLDIRSAGSVKKIELKDSPAGYRPGQ